MKDKTNILGRLAIVLTTFIWGTSFVVLKNTLDVIPTLYILAVRFGGAAVLLLLFSVKSLKKLDRSYFKGGILMGLALFLAYVFQTYGLERTTPGKNAFLTATYCVLVPFLYWITDKKRPDKFNIIAAFLCIIGVGFVSLENDFTINIGDGLTLCCGVFFGIHIIFTGRYVEGRSVALLSMLQFATAGILSGIFALLFVPPPTEVSMNEVWSVAYLCVMCTAACFVLQTYGQKYTPPSSTALIMTFESVLGAFFSVAFGYDSPEAKLFIGFILIFVSVVIAETKLDFLYRKKPPAAAKNSI